MIVQSSLLAQGQLLGFPLPRAEDSTHQDAGDVRSGGGARSKTRGCCWHGDHLLWSLWILSAVISPLVSFLIQDALRQAWLHQ